MRNGVCSVSEWETAVMSVAGATTMISPNDDRLSARAFMPSELMPSSLVTRILGIISGKLKEVQKRATFSLFTSDTFARNGRDDWIRTSDLTHPKRARYQAAPHPDI